MAVIKNRLLVVDDEEAILYAYKRLFGAPRKGMRVDTAKSLKEAEDCLKKNKYKAVVTDLRLGIDDDKGGFRLIHLIKKLDKNIKVILVTAYGNLEVERQSKAVGADYYFEKPVSMDLLMQVFKEIDIQENRIINKK